MALFELEVKFGAHMQYVQDYYQPLSFEILALLL